MLALKLLLLPLNDAAAAAAGSGGDRRKDLEDRQQPVASPSDSMPRWLRVLRAHSFSRFAACTLQARVPRVALLLAPAPLAARREGGG